ncbi:UNVERIFIED_CONTAM: hypothetical protein FKN15_027435 [Acipenser sinensis]
MALLLLAVLACISFCTVNGQTPVQVPYVPGITPNNFPGRVTASTFSLKLPLCYFSQTLAGCTAAQCEIWLVMAQGVDGQNKFDSVKGVPLDFNVNSYQAALASGKSFFMTKVGTQQSFPCDEPTAMQVFRVGSDSTCVAGSPTCNGPLPANTDARVKYVLYDPITSKKVEAESQWSQPILLTKVQVPYVPGITPNNFPGRVTASTFSLKLPLCYFSQTPAGCTAAQCEIWLVMAQGVDGQKGFDSVKGAPLDFNVNSYQAALASGKRFFMTKVGTQQSFPCVEPTAMQVFRVGSDSTSGVGRGKQDITAPTPLGSLRVKRYNTHNVHSPTSSTSVPNPNI